MTQPALKILEKAIRHNDVSTFRSTVHTSDNLHVDYLDYKLLMKALRLGRKRMTNLLLDKACHATEAGTRNSTTSLLHIAVTKVGWSSVVLKLLARGARVDICNDNGDTSIHLAFLNGAAGSVIDILLKCYMKKTLVDAVDKDGLGLLHIACTRPHLDVVRAFIDIGGSNIFSQVSLQTNSTYAGYSPLHFAVANGRYKIARSLCRYEANIGVLNRKGSTPLHLAIERRDIKMINLLLPCADWNVNYVDSSGVSHFMAACAGSDPKIVKQFLQIATDTSPNELINMISARVQDLDDCPFAGYTPMHFIAEFGCLVTMQLLINRGAHCTTTRRKVSPLDLARKRCHESIAALLERHCSGCQMCENFIPEAENNTVFVDANSNQEEPKSAVFQFNTTFAENEKTSIDECCLLNIFPVPEHNVGDEKDDCELCKLQEIFLIDNYENQYRKGNFNESETQKATKHINGVICSFQLNFKFCKYLFNGQTVIIFITVIAFIYIVACIVLISIHKFT